MIITHETRIFGFKLFDHQDGELTPVKFTTDEGSGWRDWSTFEAGTNVHALVLKGGNLWTESEGLSGIIDAFREPVFVGVDPAADMVAVVPAVIEGAGQGSASNQMHPVTEVDLDAAVQSVAITPKRAPRKKKTS